MTSSDTDQRAKTLQLMQDYQTLITQQRFEKWIDLWAEDGVLEFPFAPHGRRSRYVGKPDILAYMKLATGKFAVDAIEQMQISPMLDPGVMVVEWSFKGRVLADNAPYNQSLVIFFEVRNDKFLRHREYSNPLNTIDALGGRDQWTTGFGFPEARGA